MSKHKDKEPMELSDSAKASAAATVSTDPPEFEPSVFQAEVATSADGPFKEFGPVERFMMRLKVVPTLAQGLHINRRDAVEQFKEMSDSVLLGCVNKAAIAKINAAGGNASAIGDGTIIDFLLANWKEILAFILMLFGIPMPFALQIAEAVIAESQF